MLPLLRRLGHGVLIAVAVFGIASLASAADDFGKYIEGQGSSHADDNFGIEKPLAASSKASISAATANADPTKLATLAEDLKARVVAVVPQAANIDMMALWPDDTNPKWLIACNEQGTDEVGLIRVRIADGVSQTIVKSGLSSCDPVHRTPWNTIVFAEEAGAAGQFYELIDPLNTSDVELDGSGNPVTSTGTNPTNIVQRTALGNLSFEGVAVYPNGVVYYGDEKRPDDGNGGGSFFKFIPTTLRTGTAPITSLSQSPLVAGTAYVLQVGVRPTTDYGMGTSTGLGKWVNVTTHGSFPNLGAAAAALKMTAYYRPEDIAIDQAALAKGNVRWCGNNTGNEGNSPTTNGHTYGETVCLTDGTLVQAATAASVPELQFLVMGNPQFAMMDNIAYKPRHGSWVIMEDGEQLTGNNDMWQCLDDGQDADLLSDSCIRIATLNDLTAEWTGGVFDATGKRFFVSVQHNVTGKGVILEITGWGTDGKDGGDRDRGRGGDGHDR